LNKHAGSLLPTYNPYPFPLQRGQGEHVSDEHGEVYLDFYGGHCVASTGHCHPAVTAAIADQARRLIFYSAAAQLPIRDAAARALVDFAGGGMASVFFCNSGSEANESALKIAIKLTGRNKLVAFNGSFHGRTLLALSVTDASGLRRDYESLLTPTTFLPFGDADALQRASLSDVAAVIVEPIQSMAGVKTASPEWFAALRAKCDAAGTLLIFDEVQTGIGRLGTPFAANFYAVDPDLITCAKGMASGIPMGGVLMCASVAERLKPGDLGSTFGGGPVACAAMIATLDVIQNEALMANAREREIQLRALLSDGPARNVRGAGLLLGLEIGEQAKALKAYLQKQHILVGGSDDPGVLRLLPPLNLSTDAVQRLHAAIGGFGSRQAA
jgi:acetylornithine/N-succinyldiaminopimelate aminotransferase